MKRYAALSIAVLALAVAMAADPARGQDSVFDDGKLGIVLLHGKLEAPLGQTAPPGNSAPIGGRLIDELKSARYLVSTPEMCWSARRGFDKTYADCLKDIDGAIADLRSRGATQIIVGGLGLGGNAALAYGATHPGLLGIIAYAPADDPATRMKRLTVANSVAKAKMLMAEGKGDARTTFDDIGTGSDGSYGIKLNTTPRIYLSFHGPDSPGSIPGNTAKLKAPLLWIAGDGDPTQRSGPSLAFDKAPTNADNRYMIVSATHLETPDAGTGATLVWLAELASP